MKDIQGIRALEIRVNGNWVSAIGDQLEAGDRFRQFEPDGTLVSDMGVTEWLCQEDDKGRQCIPVKHIPAIPQPVTLDAAQAMDNAAAAWSARRKAKMRQRVAIINAYVGKPATPRTSDIVMRVGNAERPQATGEGFVCMSAIFESRVRDLMHLVDMNFSAIAEHDRAETLNALSDIRGYLSTKE